MSLYYDKSEMEAYLLSRYIGEFLRILRIKRIWTCQTMCLVRRSDLIEWLWIDNSLIKFYGVWSYVASSSKIANSPQLAWVFTGCPRKTLSRTRRPRLKLAKTKCDVKPAIFHKMNSWLLIAVYFSQFKCCNPEILQFSQDTCKSRYQLCHISLSVIQRLYHDVHRLYWFRWIQLNCREKVAQLVSWLLLEKLRYLRIVTSKMAEINGIQKPRLHLWHWLCFMSQLLFIYIKRGYFFFAQFFSDTLYNVVTTPRSLG